jgi:hypothetical protein
MLLPVAVTGRNLVRNIVWDLVKRVRFKPKGMDRCFDAYRNISGRERFLERAEPAREGCETFAIMVLSDIRSN